MLLLGYLPSCVIQNAYTILFIICFVSWVQLHSFGSSMQIPSLDEFPTPQAFHSLNKLSAHKQIILQPGI